MITSDKTAREIYRAFKDKPPRPRFGFGVSPAILNIDVQRAYTQPEIYATAYETHPQQIDHINDISALARKIGAPVVWTYVAFLASGDDACAWGIRTDTPDSIQNIKEGSDRAALDPRAAPDPAYDMIVNKRMASAFHETPINSLLTWKGVDTVIVTGGSTSGCVRASVVDALSHGYRAIVPEEAVSDRHESPHFANLYDIAAKYGDVVPVAEVLAYLKVQEPADG